MTTKADNLMELAERVEALSGPDRPLDAVIHWAVKDGVGVGYAQDAPAYTASLDTAMTLIGDDTFFHVSRFSPDGGSHGQAHVYPNRNVGDDYSAEAATPALALCAAALRAHILKEARHD